MRILTRHTHAVVCMHRAFRNINELPSPTLTLLVYAHLLLQLRLLGLERPLRLLQLLQLRLVLVELFLHENRT
jgi:hypothetical protein